MSRRLSLVSVVLLVVGLLCLPGPSVGQEAGRARAQDDAAPPRASAPGEATKATGTAIRTALGKLPLYFVENRGLYPEAVAYHVRGAEKTLFFLKDGVTFRLHDEDRAWAVKLEFVDANPDAVPRGLDRQSAVFSYFRGPRSEWKAGLPAFSRLVYEDLWPDIDLVYSGTVNRLKYAFVVKPGADPARIRLRYRGAERVRLTDAGALRVATPAGSFEDAAPEAWQEIDGKRIPVEMAYEFDAGAEDGGEGCPFGFRVGRHDPAQPLVLDPAVLVYCGYLGGSGTDYARGIAVDAAGNAYVTGYTASNEQTFPVAVGPDPTYNGGTDAFIAKVNATGTALLYCGYLGGSGTDYGYGIAVDAAGNAYVSGYTSNNEQTFPVVTGPDLTHNGGNDAFVAKVNAAGTALLYCGYVGGSGSDYGRGIAIDAAGNAYIAGYTQSSEQTFPVVIGPDLTHNGGTDAFVAKVNAAGTALLYCGYVGGSGSDYSYDIAVDAAGNACIPGYTNSTEQTFPVKVGPDLTHNGGDDAFVATVNAQGSGLVYCGYIGGSQGDYGLGIAVDAAGNAYLAGYTGSDEQTFPVTVGPDVTHNGGDDVFVAKVSAAGNALHYCGYVGGSNVDSGSYGIAVDAAGNAYLTGCTSSDEQTFPVTVGPDVTYNGGTDAFVAKVSAAGNALHYCGYVGGSGSDYGYRIAVDAVGNAYITGYTISDEHTFPVTVGPDLTHNGGFDVFLAKVSGATSLVGGGSPTPGGQVSLSLSAPGDAGLPYQIGSSFGNGPIPIDTRRIELSPDPLLFLSVSGTVPSVFQGYAGVLDARGQAAAALNIPNIPALKTIRIYTAFLTLKASAPSGVSSISNAFLFTIQ